MTVISNRKHHHIEQNNGLKMPKRDAIPVSLANYALDIYLNCGQ